MKKSIRSLRVESELYTAINKILTKKIGIFLSIVRIDVTSDLKEVRVLISNENSEYKSSLKNFAYLVQKNITYFIPFRYIPKFIFSFDKDTISKSLQVAIFFNDIHSDNTK